jgi:hypothetical protein
MLAKCSHNLFSFACDKNLPVYEKLVNKHHTEETDVMN